jgi:hypothetical protein
MYRRLFSAFILLVAVVETASRGRHTTAQPAVSSLQQPHQPLPLFTYFLMHQQTNHFDEIPKAELPVGAALDRQAHNPTSGDYYSERRKPRLKSPTLSLPTQIRCLPL